MQSLSHKIFHFIQINISIFIPKLLRAQSLRSKPSKNVYFLIVLNYNWELTKDLHLCTSVGNIQIVHAFNIVLLDRYKPDPILPLVKTKHNNQAKWH